MQCHSVSQRQSDVRPYCMHQWHHHGPGASATGTASHSRCGTASASRLRCGDTGLRCQCMGHTVAQPEVLRVVLEVQNGFAVARQLTQPFNAVRLAAVTARSRNVNTLKH